MASIVVVGGGLAGLACAWKLRRAGHEVELLERRRALATAESGVEHGWLRSTDVDALAALGTLALAWREGPGIADAFLCNGRFEALPTPTLRGLLREPGGARGRRLRWAQGTLAPARRDAGRASSQALRDGASFQAVLASALGDDPLVAKLAALAGLASLEAPMRLSHAIGLASVAACAAGSRPLFLDGGLAALRDALRQDVTVRTGCEVVDIETESSGARVRYRTQGRLRSVLADAVVAALPADALLRCTPKLTPDERGFFEAVELAPQLAVRLQLDRPPLGLPAYRVGFPAADATIRSLVAAHLEPGAAPAGSGLLIARLAAEPSARLSEASDSEVEAAVQSALEETPLGRVRAREFVVQRGLPARPVFGPGSVERMARFERRIERSPRLAFAGRHLLGPGPGAAFTSGLRAATEIVRGL